MIVAAMFYSAYVAADIIFHSQLVFVESARTFKNSMRRLSAVVPLDFHEHFCVSVPLEIEPQSTNNHEVDSSHQTSKKAVKIFFAIFPFESGF